jgi:hypothetical protein
MATAKDDFRSRQAAFSHLLAAQPLTLITPILRLRSASLRMTEGERKRKALFAWCITADGQRQRVFWQKMRWRVFFREKAVDQPQNFRFYMGLPF